MARETANKLGALALALQDRVQAALAQAFDRAGETPAAVVVIGADPGLSTDRLRRVLGLSHPGAVRLVDRLCDDGLVDRGKASDARVVALRLTAKGTRLRKKLLARRLETIEAALSVLSDAENEQLRTLIQKVLVSLPSQELENYRICRLCDDTVCHDCPFPSP